MAEITKTGSVLNTRLIREGGDGLIYASDIIWDETIPGVTPGETENQSSFVSYVFTRCDRQPDTPTGGTFNNPVPEELVKVDGFSVENLHWHDSIPEGEDTIYMSNRLFKVIDDHRPWSKPIPLADTIDFDVEYSNGQADGSYIPLTVHGYSDEAIAEKARCGWSNFATNAIWMATSRLSNGEWSDWSYAKIKGEDGLGTGRLDFDQDMINLSYDTNGNITNDVDLKKYYLSYYFNNERQTSFDYDNFYGSANGEAIICGKDENGLYVDLQLDRLPDCLKRCSYDKNVVFVEIAVTINGRLYTDTFRVLQLKNSAEYQLIVPNELHFTAEETLLEGYQKPLTIKVFKTYNNVSEQVSNLETENISIKVNYSPIAISDTKDKCVAYFPYAESSSIVIELWKDNVLYDYADLAMTRDGASGSTETEFAPVPDYQVILYKNSESQPEDKPEEGTDIGNYMINNSTTGWSSIVSSSENLWYCTVIVDGKNNNIKSVGEVLQSVTTNITNNVTGSGYIEFIFKRSLTNPGQPVSTSKDDEGNWNLPEGWTDGISNNSSLPVWMSKALISDNDSDGPQWSFPVRLVDSVDFDVEYSVEEVYSPMVDSETGEELHGFAEETESKKHALGWFDTHETDQDVDFQWMATSVMNNGVWSNWTYTKIKGEKGDSGNDGKDGAYREYIYQLSNSKTFTGDYPKDITTGTINGEEATDTSLDDFVPTGWTDCPQGVESDKKYEWASYRDKKWNITTNENGEVTAEAMEWGDFVDPFIWSAYGDKGRDGDGVEYVYHTSTENEAPNLLQNSTLPGTLHEDRDLIEFYPSDGNGERWTDDPKGVDKTNKYEWVAKRKQINGVWQDFGEPAIWATWQEGPAGVGISGIVDLYALASSLPTVPEKYWSTLFNSQSLTISKEESGTSEDVSWSKSSDQASNTKYLYGISIYRYGAPGDYQYSCVGPWVRLPNLSQTIDIISALVRMRGEWKSDQDYVKNDTYIDVVVQYNEITKEYEYFKCSNSHHSENANAPLQYTYDGNTKVSATVGTEWESFDKFENVATKVLLANNVLADLTQTGELIVGPNTKDTNISGLYLGPWHTTTYETKSEDNKYYEMSGDEKVEKTFSLDGRGVIADYQDPEHVGEAFKLIVGKVQDNNTKEWKSYNQLYLGEGLDVVFNNGGINGHIMQVTKDGINEIIQNLDVDDQDNVIGDKLHELQTSLDGLTDTVSKFDENYVSSATFKTRADEISGSVEEITKDYAKGSDLKLTADGLSVLSTEVTSNTTAIGSLQTTVDGFETQYVKIPTDGDGYVTQSQLTQTSDEIMESVRELIPSDDGGNAYVTEAMLDIKADQIRSEVGSYTNLIKDYKFEHQGNAGSEWQPQMRASRDEERNQLIINVDSSTTGNPILEIQLSNLVIGNEYKLTLFAKASTLSRAVTPKYKINFGDQIETLIKDTETSISYKFTSETTTKTILITTGDTTSFDLTISNPFLQNSSEFTTKSYVDQKVDSITLGVQKDVSVELIKNGDLTNKDNYDSETWTKLNSSFNESNSQFCAKVNPGGSISQIIEDLVIGEYYTLTVETAARKTLTINFGDETKTIQSTGTYATSKKHSVSFIPTESTQSLTLSNLDSSYIYIKSISLKRNILGYLESKIELTESSITSTVSGLASKSEIQQLENSITSKVEDIDGRVSTIEQTSDRISLKVDNQGSGNNLLPNTDFAKLCKDPDQLSSMFDQWQSHLNIKIQQTCLSVESGELFIDLTKANTTVLQNLLSNGYHGFNNTILESEIQNYSLIPGQYYTLSFSAKHFGSGSNRLAVFVGNSIFYEDEESYIHDKTNSSNVYFKTDLLDEYQKYIIKFKATAPEAQIRFLVSNGLQDSGLNDEANGFDLSQSAASIALKEIKLEKGLQCTDWCLGDLETEQRLAATGIDITSGKINMTANNFTLVNNKKEETLGVDDKGNVKLTGTVYANAGVIGGENGIHITENGISFGSDCSISVTNIDGLTGVNGESVDLSAFETSASIQDKLTSLEQKVKSYTDNITSTCIKEDEIETPVLTALQANINKVAATNIEAVQGSIGGFNIGASSLTYGTPSVNADGELNAQSSDIFGITPYGNSLEYKIASSEKKNDWRLYIGNNFGVDSQGNVYSRNANIVAQTVVENIVPINISAGFTGSTSYNKFNQVTTGTDKAYTITKNSVGIVITIHKSGSYNIYKPGFKTIEHINPIGVNFDFIDTGSHYVTLYNSDCDSVCCPNWLTTYAKPIDPLYYRSYEIDRYGYTGNWHHYHGEYEVTITNYIPEDDHGYAYQDKPIFVNFGSFANSSFQFSEGTDDREAFIKNSFIEYFGFIGGKIELVFDSQFDGSPALINNSAYSFCASKTASRNSYTSENKKQYLTTYDIENASFEYEHINGKLWTMYAGKDVTGYLIDKANMYDVDNLFK